MNKRTLFPNPLQEGLANLKVIDESKYVGRWMVIGLDHEAKNIIQIYGITGRSDGSRNRVFVEKPRRDIHTEPADESKPSGDPRLTLYPLMVNEGKKYIVSNGDQTVTVRKRIVDFDHIRNAHLCDLLDGTDYEPDPNRTARITGLSDLAYPSKVRISIIKKNPYFGDPDHFYYESHVPAGFGYFISTYADDAPPEGGTIPPFYGEPLIVPFAPSHPQTMNSYWGLTPLEHRVSMAMRIINAETGQYVTKIMNKYQKMARKEEPVLTDEYA